MLTRAKHVGPRDNDLRGELGGVTPQGDLEKGSPPPQADIGAGKDAPRLPRGGYKPRAF